MGPKWQFLGLELSAAWWVVGGLLTGALVFICGRAIVNLWRYRSWGLGIAEPGPGDVPMREKQVIATLVLLFLAVAVFIVWPLPGLLVSDPMPTTPGVEPSPTAVTATATERSSVRTAALGALAALGAGFGLWYTHRNFRHQVHDAARVNEDRRRTFVAERFNDAVKQLADDDMSVRVAGVYSMESVAQQDASRLQSVLDVLAAFVTHRPRPKVSRRRRLAHRIAATIDNTFASTTEDPPGRIFFKVLGLVMFYTWIRSLRRLRRERATEPDVKAALIVLARMRWSGPKVLIGTDLAGLDLAGTDLAGAELQGADLSNATLTEASLVGANLCGTNLDGANLVGANLMGADLRGANLRFAYLTGADLEGANTGGALVRRSQLDQTQLAQMDGAPSWLEDSDDLDDFEYVEDPEVEGSGLP